MEAVVVDHECCGGVPPGFRFHPTEEELVGYYLARKVASQKIDLDIIQEVDLYRIEPWDLQRRLQLGGGGSGSGDQCFFFSYKDRKYPSGTRTNRATAAGFWKATGRDKPVLSSSSSSSRSGSNGAGRIVIGMRKTLVFYKGRAPNGRKTDWIIHEYRLLLPSTNNPQQQQREQEGWVVCRAFRKPTTIPNNIPPPLAGAAGAYAFFGSSTTSSSSSWLSHQPQLPLDLSYYPPYADEPPHKTSNNNLLLMRIPQLIDDDSPTAAVHIQGSGGGGRYDDDAAGSIIDWNFLDTLLSSSTAAASSFAAPP